MLRPGLPGPKPSSTVPAILLLFELCSRGVSVFSLLIPALLLPANPRRSHRLRVIFFLFAAVNC